MMEFICGVYVLIQVDLRPGFRKRQPLRACDDRMSGKRSVTKRRYRVSYVSSPPCSVRGVVALANFRYDGSSSEIGALGRHMRLEVSL